MLSGRLKANPKKHGAGIEHPGGQRQKEEGEKQKGLIRSPENSPTLPRRHDRRAGGDDRLITYGVLYALSFFPSVLCILYRGLSLENGGLA